MSNRLTDADLKVLKSGGTYVVGNNDYWNSPIFGSDTATDKVEIHVYDLNDNLIKSGVVPDSEIASSGNIILKPGDTLRQMGFLSGDFKVVYNFLRNVAGQDDIVLVETLPEKLGQVYSGPPSVTGFERQNYWVNEDGVIFKGQRGDTSMPEELDIRELKYFIQDISPSKTEIRLAPLDIKLAKYKDDFAKLYTDEKIYVPIHLDGRAKLHLQDSSTFEFTVADYHSSDPQINEFMVDGVLRIENAFVIGYDVSQTSLTIHNTNLIETEFDYSPDTTPWDASLHVDAVKPNHNWSLGYQGWVPSPGVGYHPMWVEGEGKDGTIAIKFIDNNTQYGFENRQMSVFNGHNESLASKGITHGDIIKVTWNQKTNADKSINVRAKYIPFFTEEMPMQPPTGFTGSWVETQPTAPPTGFVDGFIEDKPTNPPDGFITSSGLPAPPMPPPGYSPNPNGNPMSNYVTANGEWRWQTYGGGTSGEWVAVEFDNHLHEVSPLGEWEWGNRLEAGESEDNRVWDWFRIYPNPSRDLKIGTLSPMNEWMWLSNVEPGLPPVPEGFDAETNTLVGTVSENGRWTWTELTIPIYGTPGAPWYFWIETDPSPDTTYDWYRVGVNPNLNTLEGQESPDGEWVWTLLNGADANNEPTYGWVQDTAADQINKSFPRHETPTLNVWEEKSSQIEIPSNWDLSREHSFAIDGARGDDGIMWVSDVKIEYIYKNTIIETPKYAPFESKITSIVSNNLIYTENSWDELRSAVGGIETNHSGMETYPYSDWTITYKTGDAKNLITLLNFGENNLALTVNHKKDDVVAVQYPHSIVYKLYEPISKDIKKGDLCWVVKEMLPQHTETVSLIPFVEDKVDAVVLRQPIMSDIENEIDNTAGKYESKETLLSSNSSVSTQLKNLILSSSLDSVNLNVEYGQFENFVHFGSAARVKNFKSKLTTIDSYLVSSASLALTNYPATSSLTAGIKAYENKIYEVENNLDPFEKYMYFESSSYSTSSNGEIFSNSWPKQNSSKPYIHYAVTSSQAIAWYTTTVASSSLYDLQNRDRLVNLTPLHVGDDSTNEDYMTFLNMIGQYFDGIWVYIKAMSDVHIRDDKLTQGLSKDLVYPVAKSLGWDLFNGKSLVSLPKYKLGYTVTGSTYSTTSAVSEEDISKEIWNRLINNMPYFLKTKGTKRALEGLINCYGIPSTILRIKEYGGPDKTGKAPSYEITRKFTKALDFKGAQYVQTTWSADSGSGRKPDTVEFRFKSATGSNQTLANVGDAWGIYLKDNGSVDNYGSVAFALSGSNGYEIVSSSALPIYDGEFYSVMLKRNVIPSISSTVSQSAVSYNDARIKLTDVSTFTPSGQITVTNSENFSFTLDYDTKNLYTNELVGVSGWPRYQIKSSENTLVTADIPTGSFVNQVSPITTDAVNQKVKYELAVKKYNASISKIQYSSVVGLTIATASVNPEVSESYNASYSASGVMSIGGSSGNVFGSQFSGSMMEFRYWNSPLNMTAFDNHVEAPKSFNGNHPSASYTDLVLRYSFDDNTNLASSPTIRDTSADQTYIQTGTAVGFASEINFSSVEDEQKMLIPDIGPNRCMASKIRLETNTIIPEADGNRLLSSNIRREKSSFDTAPIDSNLLGVYFAPTDVINEDIIMSVANLDFNQYIGDPRDRTELTYKDLNKISDSYWQKYKSPNNFWDYMRLIKYYDNSLFSQLQKLIPFRASSRVGILIEPNILERSKVVISEKIDWTNHSYEDTIDVSVTTTLTGSEDYYEASHSVILLSYSGSYDAYAGSASVNWAQSGSYDLWRGYIGYDADGNYTFDGDVFHNPAKYILTGSYYQSGSLGVGIPLFIFEEALEPYVSGSRLSTRAMVHNYFYSSRYSQSIDDYYSSSLSPAEYSVLLSRSMLNLYYDGCKQTQDTTTDGKLPVEITITSPTVLTTKEPGESKLKAR